MPPRRGAAAPGSTASSPIFRIIAFAIALRLLSAALGMFANVVFPLQEKQQFTVMGRPHAFWDAFARYDSGWYHGIARDGYAWVEGGRSNLAFFPAYPLSMRHVGRLLGSRPHHLYLGGILISWVAFVVALLLLYRLARLDVDEEAALRAVHYAALFPFAFFYGLVYSEALFLCLMVASFYGFRTRNWALAGLAGAVAVCTRVNGIMAAPAMAWIAWSSVREDRKAWPGAVTALALVAAGFATWCAFNWQLSGNPLEWKASIERWGYYPGGLPTQLSSLAWTLLTRPYDYLVHDPAAPADTLNGLSALLVVACIPFVWWRLGTGYALFMAANLALPLSSGSFLGLGRYCLVLFPFFIWLGGFHGQTTKTAIVGVFTGLYALCLALFTTLHPIY